MANLRVPGVLCMRFCTVGCEIPKKSAPFGVIERSAREIAINSLEWHSSGVEPTSGWSRSLSDTISNL